MINKRGLVIRKNDIKEFDEQQDHIPNLTTIIENYYKDYVEYIKETTNMGLCIAITNKDDIVIINASYDSDSSSFINYLPSKIDLLTEYQTKELLNVLTEMTGSIVNVSFSKMFDYPQTNNSFTTLELINLLKEQLNNYKTRSAGI